MKYSVVIPCYNEADNIASLVKRISEAYAQRQDEIEVILVNNGSTDRTAEAIENELKNKTIKHLKSITVSVNQGYGFGILSGLEACEGEFLGWTHADMQTDPADLLKAFDKLESTVDPENTLVKGSRKKRKFLENFFTFGMQVYVKSKLGVWLKDINAQPKVFSRSFYETKIKGKAPHDFSLDLFLLYEGKKNRLCLETVPVDFSDRLHGVAKGGGGADFKTRMRLVKRTMHYVKSLSKNEKKH